MKSRYNPNLYDKITLGAGMLLRLIYVSFSTIYDRQHDIGMIKLSAGHPVTGGHLGYIQYIYENLRIPDVDPTGVYQFHHPPLHHFISALWMHLVSLFTNRYDVIEESMQVVPFVCSLITLVVIYFLLRELEIPSFPRSFVMLFMSVQPGLIILSGSVNNDCMGLMFTVLIIYYTVLWSKNPSLKNILLLAIFMGAGISTKQNVAQMAFPVALVFIYKFFKSEGEDELQTKNLIGEYLLFGVVSIPLGMWFYIRNLIKFNTSLLWVYELPEDSWQYTGNVPLVNRFLWPNVSEMIDNVKHFRIGCGYNVWMQIMRTSVLGEWDMADAPRIVKIIAVILMLSGAFLGVVSLICFVRALILKRTTESLKVNTESKILLVSGYVITMMLYFIFVYRYPQQCSMDFRYITVVLVFLMIGFALDLSEIKNEIIKYIFKLSLGAYVVASLLMLSVWCFTMN